MASLCLLCFVAAISFRGDYFLPPFPPFPLPFFFFFLPGGTIPSAMMSAFNSSTAQYFRRFS